MNLKPIVRLQCRHEFRIFRTMYLIVYLIMAVTVLSALFFTGPDRGHVRYSGMEIATMVTIFVTGLNSFREFFLFYTANGVSRRRMFAGVVLSLGIAAAATALLDTVSAAVYSLFLDYSPLYGGTMQLALSGTAEAGGFDLSFSPADLTPVFLLKNLLWSLFAYFDLALFGLLLTVLYYRMDRAGKILFSIGVPAFFFLLLPFLDRYAAGGSVGSALSRLAGWWTACGMNPFADALTRLLLAAALSGLVFLLVRRAEVKR